MKKSTEIFRNPLLYIGILLVTTGIFVFQRSYFRVPNFDEVVYGFVLNAKEYGGYYHGCLTTKLTEFSEVISSQINHYFFQNGRSLVHAVEQIFTGIIGVGWYNLFNTLLFISLVILMMRLGAPKGHRNNILLWTILTIILMYLFPCPESLWYSINLAPNYLMPGVLMIAVLLAFRYVSKQETLSNPAKAAIILLCFVFGWSHEAYSLPVIAATLISYFSDRQKFENRGGWIILIPVMIGAAIMVSAPGYWSRLGYYKAGYGNNLSNYFIIIAEMLYSIYPFWIMIVIIAVAKLCHKIRIKEFLQENRLIVLSMIFAYALCIALHTPIRGYTSAELLSTCLIIKILTRFNIFSRNSVSGICIAGILFLVFTAHQILVVRDVHTNYLIQQRLIDDYKRSDDGIVGYQCPDFSPLTNKFVQSWHIPEISLKAGFLETNCMTPEKKILAYTPQEYRIIKDVDYIIARMEKVAGNSPFVATGNKHYWADADSIGTKKIELEYEALDFSYDAPILLKLKFALVGDSYPSHEIVTPNDTITTESGHTYYRVIAPGVRRVKAIRLTDGK